MPQDLLMDAQPSEAQRAFMESHGFHFEEQTEDDLSVTWCGHGVKLTLSHNSVPTQRSICELTAQESRKAVIEGLRRKFWRFLGTPPLNTPVPFEIVEMEIK